MRTENGEVLLEVGDEVDDALSGVRLMITDVFWRDGQRVVELTDGHGGMTTALPKYLRLPRKRETNIHALDINT